MTSLHFYSLSPPIPLAPTDSNFPAQRISKEKIKKVNELTLMNLMKATKQKKGLLWWSVSLKI